MASMPVPVMLTIGGKSVVIPTPMNFKKIKKVWPLLQETAKAEEGVEADMLAVFDQTLAIFEIALAGTNEAMTVDDMEEALLGTELMGLQRTLKDLISASGMATEAKAVVGNDEPNPENLSTEILTPSSVN